MGRTTKPLKDAEIRAAKPGATLYDGGGLELHTKNDTACSKLWRLRYYRPVTKKRTMMSLGQYPAVTLAHAREKREEALRLLLKGIDPVEFRSEQQAKKAEESANTFRRIAELWFSLKRSQNLAEGTLNDIWRSLEKYVLPEVGSRPVTELTARTFIEILKPISAQGKADTVRRLAQRINEVMYYAVNAGFIPANPAAKISKAFSAPIVRNMPAITPSELPGLMQALAVARIETQTRLVIEWQLLTICRPAEAAGIRWDEIDLSRNQWRIPAGRIKQRREHIVPLCRQALAILEAMRPISGSREFVFPHNSDPKRPMCEQTANAALKRMGYGGRLVAHGLRSIASTALNEEGFASDVIEAALSHIDKDEVRRIYNRTTYLEKRKKLMDWWGDFVEQAGTGNLSAADGIRGLRVIGK